MMRKRWFVLVIVFFSVGILGACGSNEETNDSSDKTSLEMIEVDVKTQPSEIKSGEVTEIQANVSQGDEKVSDADEVQFEIWKEGAADNEHIKKKAKLQKDGQYVIDFTFDETGKYFIIAHVTARDLHNMPKIEVNVQ